MISSVCWPILPAYVGKATVNQNKGARPVVIRELLAVRSQFGDHLQFAVLTMAGTKMASASPRYSSLALLDI